MGFQKSIRIAACSAAVLVAGGGPTAAQKGTNDDEAASPSMQAALERVQTEARLGGRGRADAPRVAAGIPVRRRSTLGTADPVFRNGIPYYDEWTIRAGTQRLRLPGYGGWQAVKPSSDFYEVQANTGEPGYHLAAALTNAAFARSTRSKYVNYFALIWVPQIHAFQEFTLTGFEDFKEELKLEIVEERKQRVKRDDFTRFDDYINFKYGNDEAVGELLDGYLVRSDETEDLLMFFARSEFVYQRSRDLFREPMIMTVTYALVHGKLLRIDFKRLYTSDEDSLSLIAFSRQFVQDMRTLNGLSEYEHR